MTRMRALTLFAAAAVCLPVFAQVSITRSGSQPSRQGSSENFTGAVRVDSLFDAQDGARASGGRVTFQPGARSAWHTHPLGQILIVTSGTGWVQEWGGPNGRSAKKGCRPNSAGPQALAWCNRDDYRGAHRHSGTARR